MDATLDINRRHLLRVKAVLPHLQVARGNVVDVASDAGLIGEKGLFDRRASKGGVVTLTRAMALEPAPDSGSTASRPG